MVRIRRGGNHHRRRDRWTKLFYLCSVSISICLVYLNTVVLQNSISDDKETSLISHLFTRSNGIRSSTLSRLKLEPQRRGHRGEGDRHPAGVRPRHVPHSSGGTGGGIGTVTRKKERDLDWMKAEAARTDKTHLLNILLDAGATVDEATLEALPSWKDVTLLYGDKPKIVGLETCAEFQEAGRRYRRQQQQQGNNNRNDKYKLAPAGMFHSATNLFTTLMGQNCRPVHKFWPQVPWGKHAPATWRQKNVADRMGLPVEEHSTIMPVVMIKDPFTWMGSMCRNKYSARWPHSEEHCPNLVPNEVDFKINSQLRLKKSIPVRIRYSGTNITEHDSLVGLWNDYYGAYHHKNYSTVSKLDDYGSTEQKLSIAPFPRIMVRFEDLIFHTQDVVTQICQCAGGRNPREDGKFKYTLESAKIGVGGHSSQTGLMQAMIHYGNLTRRSDGFSPEDILFANQHLASNLMKDFGYPPLPPPKTQDLNRLDTSGNEQHERDLAWIKEEAARTNKTRILNMLLVAGVDMDRDTLKSLPSWQDVTLLYGEKPKILGLETCEEFRNTIPQNKRFLAPAGMFNSGTNLLDRLLGYNCAPRTPTSVAGKWPQVPWGKHTPATWRKRNMAQQMSMPFKDHDRVMPIVMIKDPFTWMGSMCRNRYSARWPHAPEHCPNLVPNEVDFKLNPRLHASESVPVNVRYAKANVTKHESLVHLWNDYYGAYHDISHSTNGEIAPFPRLMVRFEDLLFYPQETVSQVCQCVGGTIYNQDGQIQQIAQSVKAGKKGHKSEIGLLEAMIHYGNVTRRLDGVTEKDLQFANQHLATNLMTDFGYPFPEFTSPTKNRFFNNWL